MQRIGLLLFAALTLDGALAFAPGVALSLKQTRGCRLVQPASISMQLDPSKKETTLDKLVGPKLFKSVEKVTGVHAVPIVPLRIVSGILMIHHGNEGGVLPANFGTEAFKGFIDFIMKPYFSFLPGDLSLWAALHDYAEFFGGIFLAIGFLTRPAALSLFLTMCGAVYFHLASTGLQGFPLGHVPSYSYNFEEPALYALIFLLFFFNGAGPLSVDSVIYSNISAEAEEE
mmetsp:Transcript_20776/g.41871  ORF Transcript_20776/g.41871 Transcript_20776/m.41871 type:complete len:229 (+) Transcript_20776:3-689(+)